MTIIRSARLEQDFTILPNAALRDPWLSYRARGILAYVLSMPDNWETNSVALARQGREGRDAIRAAILELIDAGYVRRQKRQDDRGQWRTDYYFHDRRSHVGILGKIRGQGKQPKTGNQSSDSQALIEELTLRTTKDLESVLESEPKLCGQCQGAGVIEEQHFGGIISCPDCKGDGIARP